MKALLVFLALCASASAQQTTYAYIGQVMSGTLTGQLIAGNANANITQMVGTVTLAAPLNPNQANQVVTPIAFSFAENMFNQTVDTPASVNINGTPDVWSFTTVNGVITAWSIAVNFQSGWEVLVMGLSDSAGDAFTYIQDASDCSHEYCVQWSASNAAGGSWYVPQSTAAQVATLQSQLAVAQRQLTAAQTTNAAYLATNATLLTATKDLQTENGKYFADITTLAARVTALVAKVAALQAELVAKK